MSFFKCEYPIQLILIIRNIYSHEIHISCSPAIVLKNALEIIEYSYGSHSLSPFYHFITSWGTLGPTLDRCPEIASSRAGPAQRMWAKCWGLELISLFKPFRTRVRWQKAMGNCLNEVHRAVLRECEGSAMATGMHPLGIPLCTNVQVQSWAPGDMTLSFIKDLVSS